MRGFYSAGILRGLLDNGVAFPFVAGVSSGALAATAFVAGRLDFDFGRLAEAVGGFANPRGLVRPREGLLRTDALVDFFLDGCHGAVMASASSLNVPATCASTGELVWWNRRDFAAGPRALRERVVASASIPVVMPEARVDGAVFVDGGIRDSIPIDRAEAAGYTRHVLLLTRPRGYVKGRQHLELYLRRWLRPYPALKRAMLLRHVHYNESARRAERLEDEGRAFVFRLSDAPLGRFEYAPEKFAASFEAGRRACEERLGELRAWLARG
jgi:predicted patatin/cPLA2 family phospholipase